MAFSAGKSGSVTVSNTTYKFKNWTLKMHADALDTTNFDSTGDKKENIEGLGSGTLSLEGPYDQGVMLFAAGTSYTWVLNAGVSSFSIPARITDISINTDVEGAVRVSIEAVTTGNYTASLPA